MKKGQVVIEAILVLTGRVEWCQLVLFLYSWAFGDLILSNKVFSMDLFYIPTNAMILFVISMAIGGLVGAIGWACIMKAESNGKSDTWATKYLASTALTIFAAPILTSILLGWACQTWFADIDSGIYCLVLIISTFAIAKYVLLFFNVGVKDALAMLKSDVSDAANGVADVKQTVEESKDEIL